MSCNCSHSADRESGLVVVVSGPSGAGKTTVCKLLTEKYGYEPSVSATTRAPRVGELNGREYYFVTREDFLRDVERGEFLEHSEHFDNLYGTPRGPVARALAEGRTILLEIDVNGAKQVMERLPEAYCIFLTAPDFKQQEERLRGRHTESEAAIRTRLQRVELEHAAGMDYDERVVNDDLHRTVERIHSLISRKKESKEHGCRST